jgi:hypothetical protein
MAIDVAALSTALQNSPTSPAQLLGRHRTTSQEMQAVAILDQMAAQRAWAPLFTSATSTSVLGGLLDAHGGLTVHILRLNGTQLAKLGGRACTGQEATDGQAI